MSEQVLSVRLQGHAVGLLEQDRAGKMSFHYLEEATRALSFSLPLGKAVFGPELCTAFFGGLLPEGGQVRGALAKQFGISANNDFALLKAIGGDCAGAVSLHDVDEPIDLHIEHELQVQIIDDAELAGLIRNLPRRPLFIDPARGMRLSLAGVQQKAVVCVVDGKIGLPLGSSPSTHIIKPAISGYENTVLNEYFCLRLAARLGLSASNVELGCAEDQLYLLVSRYDRQQLANGRWKRIHQEDFCQALGIVSAKKYQNEGGPRLQDCFALLSKSSAPAADRLRLARFVIFNYLSGNNDAHGKNFSLLHQDDGTSRLAPLYDAMCTSIYPELDKKMAMKIASQYNPGKVQAYHWKEMCQENQLNYPQLRKYILEQTEALVREAKAEAEVLCSPSFPMKGIEKIYDFFNSRTVITRQRFALA